MQNLIWEIFEDSAGPEKLNEIIKLGETAHGGHVARALAQY